MRTHVYALVAAALVVRPACAGEPATPESVPPPRAKQVILLIADGAGFNHFRAASLYEHGEEGRQVYDAFPCRLAVSTHAADGAAYDPEAAWASFEYFYGKPTDSAAAATAMASGRKTRSKSIGVDPAGKPLSSIVDLAESAGKRSGLVTSVPLSHATPAAFAAHLASREDYKAIAREMIEDSALDVLMGAGHPWYDIAGRSRVLPKGSDYVGGLVLWGEVQKGGVGGDADGDGAPDPWTLVTALPGFLALTNGPAPRRVLGVTPVYKTLQQERPASADRDGDGRVNDADAAKAKPFEDPRTGTVPTLADMARGALNVLDDDPDGFFLMVEGGAVDWAAHDHQPGRMVEEMMEFNRAVEAVTAWVEARGGWNDTLVIVTADHETGYLTGPGSGAGASPKWKPIESRGAGVLPEMEWHSGGHSNQLVPLYAKGPGAALLEARATRRDPVRGPFIENTDIGAVMAAVIGAPR